MFKRTVGNTRSLFIVSGLALGLMSCKATSTDAETAVESNGSVGKAAAPSLPASDADLETIKASIAAGLAEGKAGVVVSSIEAAPIPGMYKVLIENGPALYATSNGKHFVVGDMYEVVPGNFRNLTEAAKNDDRAAAVATLKDDDMIIFAPKGEVKAELYVFTDVDCGYCQLLHSKVPEMNEMGIQVNYLAYPRAGIPSNSYSKIASAWCATDKQDALTKLKNREDIPENVCEKNPVQSQFDLGRNIGINGTPALITGKGELIAGYVEPERLAQMLDL